MASEDRNRAIAIWIVSGFLALVFLASGGFKLVPGSPAAQAFGDWGLPQWFRYFVGACEVAGAVGLLVPRLAPFAAVGLALLMGGAIQTHLKAGEVRQASVPILLVTLLVPIAIARWRSRKKPT